MGVGAGPAPALGGAWAQAGRAPERTSRSNRPGQRIMALIIPTPKEQGKQCGQKTTGPGGGLPPGPGTSHQALEAETNASRGDGDRIDTDVPADRGTRAGIVVAADEPVSQGVVGHQVTGCPVEREARREPVREGQVELGSDELILTLWTAALQGLPADEARLQTTVGHDVGVIVHLVHGPARRDTRAHGEGRGPRIACLEASDDATVLVPADFRARVTRGARGTHDLVVVDTQGDDLGAPVRQITGVRIQRLEIPNALVRVARRVLTRSCHDQMGEEERSELIAGPHVDQPSLDVGRLPGALRAVGRRHTARIPLRLRTELVIGRRIDRPRARPPPRVDADGVAILVHARACTVCAGDAAAAINTGTSTVGRTAGRRGNAGTRGVRSIYRSEGTAGRDGHAAATLTSGRRGEPIEEGGRDHRLDVQALHDRDLWAADEGPVVTTGLRLANAV